MRQVGAIERHRSGLRGRGGSIARDAKVVV